MRLFDRFPRPKATAQPGQASGSEDADARSRRRRLPAWKRILFITVSNLLALSLLAAIGELACRLLAPQVDYGTLPDWTLKMLRFSDDMFLGWELRPGEHDHNSLGIRGPEATREKPEGLWRIAIIGDSVTYGLHVEADEAYPSVLEAKLNEAGIGPVEVLNFGVPGYNTFQEYTLLRTRVLQFDPDLVIMTFTADDVETTPVIINVGGNMCLFRNHFEGVGLLNNSIHWAVFRSSHLYRFLYKHAALAFAAPEAGFEVGNVQPEVQWANVRRAAELCRERDTAFLLVLSPWLLPYCPPPKESVPGVLSPDQFRRYAQAFDQVRELATGSGLPWLDLGPLYAEHVGTLKLKPVDHEHLNPLGHTLVAERLLEKLLSMKAQTRKVPGHPDNHSPRSSKNASDLEPHPL
jgi:lysophospholipase L1-like esterase